MFQKGKGCRTPLPTPGDPPGSGLVTKRAGVHRATRSSPMTAQERVMAGLAEAEQPEAQAPTPGLQACFLGLYQL